MVSKKGKRDFGKNVLETFDEHKFHVPLHLKKHKKKKIKKKKSPETGVAEKKKVALFPFLLQCWNTALKTAVQRLKCGHGHRWKFPPQISGHFTINRSSLTGRSSTPSQMSNMDLKQQK